MKSILEKVEQFAATAHEGQRRKFRDEPYINHPVRVMQLCSEQTTSLPVLAAALLHDVLEDTPVTADQIREFLSPLMDSANTDRTLKLVDELTDRFVKANYPEWNRRKRKLKEAERLSKISAEAQMVKYADIIDNSTEFASAETDFAAVYLRECNTLLQKMTKGDPVLHKKAQDTVQKQLELLK